MATLTKEQAEFLSHHNISKSEVLDATNMRPKDYKKIMSEQGLRVAIGVTPCKKAGHTMRAANGHCVMCKPANLMYRKRFRESGYVYIATTKERNDLIKVGYCQNIEERESSLNIDCYGGYSDWSINSFRKSEEKGVLEHAMHKALQKYSFSTTYFHDGQEQTATELFRHDLGTAIALLKTIEVNHSKVKDVVEKVNVQKLRKSTNNSNKKSPNCEPPKKQKIFREIDSRKNKNAENSTLNEKSPNCEPPKKQKIFREIDSRKNKNTENSTMLSSNSDEQEKNGIKWYHWILLYLAFKAILTFLGMYNA